MSDEIRLEGLGVAPGVLETIAALATQSVDGVAHIPGPQGLAGLVPKSGARGVTVSVIEDGSLHVVLHLTVCYGTPLRDVATAVQRAVGDALLTQTGQQVSAVDVFIDDIQFEEQ
ncbi:MAG: Asp23/Gls24 family envelope stress response protein [Coriobacteriia bacterium]|nr:Asp23/Gls24 family envelope stress response protein [Coriobacteriia bacterium]